MSGPLCHLTGITGEVLRGPATDSLVTYRVIVDGDIGRIEAASGAVEETAAQNT